MHNQIKCAIIPHAFGLGGTLYLPLLISFPFYSNANYGSEARPIYTRLSAGRGEKLAVGSLRLRWLAAEAMIVYFASLAPFAPFNGTAMEIMR